MSNRPDVRCDHESFYRRIPRTEPLYNLMLRFMAYLFTLLILMGSATVHADNVYSGDSPPIEDSSASLILPGDLQTDQRFRWTSEDPILGRIDTGAVEASMWRYFPSGGSGPARLVFRGAGDSAVFYGNVLFADYDRAVVDVVRGGKRVRYVLRVDTTGFSVEWLTDELEPAEIAAAEGSDVLAPFSNEPGTPGGPGGFGGPPADSGFSSLADSYRITDFEITNGGSGTDLLTLTLNSNVTAWTQSYVLEETEPGTDIFADSEDSLALQLLIAPLDDAAEQERIEIFIVSMAFGARRTMTLYETGPATGTFESERLLLIAGMTGLPTPGVVDVIDVTLSSSLAPSDDSGSLIETGPDTLVFENIDGSLSLDIDRITGNGVVARDDFTAFVSSTLLGILSAEVDAIETTADSLEFRTDALANQGPPGTGPGAIGALGIGSRWMPTLHLPNGIWPFVDSEVRVAVQRRRGNTTTPPTRIYYLKWVERDFFEIEVLQPDGSTRTEHYHPVIKGDNTSVFFLLVREDLANPQTFVRNGGNINAHVLGGDHLIARRWEHDAPKDEILILEVDLDMDGVDEDQEETRGGFVAVNTDNDNGSALTNRIPATRDREINPIAGEDDLQQITLSVAPADSPGTVRLRSVENGDARIRIWDSMDKQNEVRLPKTYAANQLPLNLFVEGVQEGTALRRTELVLELVLSGQAATTSDRVLVTVTPVLTDLSATAAAGSAPGLVNDANLGWALVTEAGGGGNAAFTLFASAFRTNVQGQLKHSQTVRNGGTGANLGGGVMRTYDFAPPNNGGALMDANNAAGIPFYVLNENHGGNADNQTVTNVDNPALPLTSGLGVMPAAGATTGVNVIYDFTLHATWEFDDDSVYFLGSTDWSVEYDGDITQPPMPPGANPVFNAGANNRNQSSTGITRNNNLPARMTRPVANNGGSQWR